MKIGPKLPGPVGPAGVPGAKTGEAPRGAGKAQRARFADALAPAREGKIEGTAQPAGAVAEAAARYGAGELTRTEAARQVADAAVQAWPDGLTDPAMRARAVEALVEALAEDPAFSALLDAAAGKAE